ncbi:MAG: Glycosyl transferase group 1 [Parcubacteria group bacterium GW2011_GWB1_41_4]|nr:MAG: Glycosyl transferase group 1 [Parcubacteria group bacterium GW2011_GWB1_41_4]
MRILYITGSYLPYVSGVTLSIKNFKEELENLGHEVILLAPWVPGFKDQERNVRRYPAVPVPFFKDFSIPLPFLFPKVFSLIFKEHFDLIHVHHPFYIGSFAWLVARLKKIPLVFSYHTRYDSEFVGALKSRAVKKLTVDWVNAFCKKVDLIIANSRFTEKYLRERDRTLSIAVIPNGIKKPESQSLDQRSKKAFLRDIGLTETNVVCLCVSRLSREKNLELAIKSLLFLPENFFLLIAGQGPYEKKLKDLARDLGLGSRIKFLGKQSQEDLVRFYQVADVFVYPSFSETQGLVVFEASSFGLPSATLDSDLSNEVFLTKTLKSTAVDPEGFAQTIKAAYGIGGSQSKSLRNWSEGFTTESLVKHLAVEYKKVVDVFRLNQTGWQSWSVNPDSWFRFPRNRFNPLYKTNYEVEVKDRDRKKSKIVGWNSWTAFGFDVSEEKVLLQADWLKQHPRIPVDYLVIDDGWTRWGDWLSPDRKKFPQGLKNVNEEIKKRGLKPGIWMAPFLVEEKSELFKLHQLWLAKYKDGPIDGLQMVPIVEAFSVFIPEIGRYLLDFKKPEVWSFIFKSIDHLVSDLGFKLLKLDFLFSPYFYPGISPKEASEAVQKLLKYVKEKHSDVFTIGCGCPLSDAMGLVDAMRIGPDVLVAPLFSNMTFPINHWKIKKIKENVSRREWTERFWLLDPDVFVCRKGIGLMKKDILSLRDSIKRADGLVFLGDDLTKLNDQEIDNYIFPLFQ